jgi:archaea-specific DNA-binding protein
MSDIAEAVDIENGFDESGEEEPNIVRIGKKPIMNYVVACMTLLNNGVSDVMVRGRGQSITKAVETVDMLRRAFLKNIKIYSVDIGTEEVKREDGSIASLSMIEIILGH